MESFGGDLRFMSPMPFDEDQLLRAVTAGLIQSVEPRKARQVRGELEDRLIALTPRENQVFWLVVKGLLNKQIAAHLGTKEGTVKLHRANVMRKLHAQSVADLVRIADRLEGSAGPSVRGGDFPHARQDAAQQSA
jgi:FixJ family two-component response regulator